MGARRAGLLVLAAVIGAGAAAGASFLVSDRDGAGPGRFERRAVAGEPAPSLSGRDVVTGRPVGLDRFVRKPVVVNVWASWCADCATEAPALRRFAERHHRDTRVLGLDVEDTLADARAFYRENGWQHPSIFDPNEKIAAQLGIETLPTTIFLNRDHRIVTRIAGPATVAELTSSLRRAEQAP